MENKPESDINKALKEVLQKALDYFVDLTNQSLESSEQGIDPSHYSVRSYYSVSYSYLKFVEFIFAQFKPTKVEIKSTNQEPSCENEWTISQIQLDNEEGETGSLTLRQAGYACPQIDLKIEPKVEKPENERRLDATLKFHLNNDPCCWKILYEVYCRVPGEIDDGKIQDFYLFECIDRTEDCSLVRAGHWNTVDLPGEFYPSFNDRFNTYKEKWYMKDKDSVSGYYCISGQGAITTFLESRDASARATPDKYVKFWVEGNSRCKALESAFEFYNGPAKFISCYDGVEKYQISDIKDEPTPHKKIYTPPVKLSN